MNKNLNEICHLVTDIKNEYVGIVYKDNKINIYFPIGYEIPKTIKEQKTSIFELISAINLVKKEKQDEVHSDTLGEEKTIPINSYIWLINDYLSHNLYYELEKSYKPKINGKINWKRTLRTKFYLSNNNAVYLEPMIEKSIKEENIITMIQIFCLKESLSKVGFLYEDIILPTNILTNENIPYYIEILKNKLTNSYLDHNKELLNHMIIILEEKNNSKLGNNILKFGTYHFNIAWEKMVDKVYGNIKGKEFFPSAKYHLNNEEYKTADMLPDTIINYNHNLYILDSKYYRYGITKNKSHLPGTNSITKQITYGEYASKNAECHTKSSYENVYNAFILPYNKEDNENIKYLGYAENGLISAFKTYEKIAVILIDTKYLMDCYFKKEEKNLSELINKIEKIKNKESD